MARDIKDLQKLIEERATERLEVDLIALGKLVEKHPLLGVGDDGPQLAYNVDYGKIVNERKVVRYETQSIGRLFGATYYNQDHLWGEYLKQLRQFWLPKYIEEESKAFLDKLDQIQNDVDYLLNNQPLQ